MALTTTPPKPHRATLPSDEAPASSTSLLDVRHLTVAFKSGDGVVRAVNDVSFSLDRGERLAIVGESGSGKSVMSMALMQMIARGGRIESGEVVLNGRDLLPLSNGELRRVRGKEVAMVFQDPTTSLNPIISVHDQITPPLKQHLGLDNEEARARGIELLVATGIPDPERNIDAFPHQLSGGMRQRVMIAIAISCNPDLLIADEPTTALDVTIQAQIVALLKQISQQQNSSVIFVTHDMGLVARFADRVAVMYAGRIVETGPVREIFANPEHPYTRGLLGSIPSIEGDLPERLTQIPGAPPNLAMLGPGCAFAPRCGLATGQCEDARPDLATLRPLHLAACWAATPDERATAGTPGPAPRVGRPESVSEMTNGATHVL